MNKNFVARVFVTVVSLAFYGCTTYEPRGWQPRDMNSRVGRRVEAELKPDAPFCFAAECNFDLHYFFGQKYDGPDPDRKPDPNRISDPDRKIILFIPGGPGEIVDREKPILDYLANDQNIVYFDVRGTGFSTIPESNQYDQFLRAEYVVEDIETLRKKIFNECASWESPATPVSGPVGERDRIPIKAPQCRRGVKPWDAIYAHSWGTIVAQQYAARYHKMVSKLILSAPVSRGHDDTEAARRKMIVDNLVDIFRKYSSTICYWPVNDDLVNKSLGPMADLTGLDNFCFLKNEAMSIIRDAFTKFLNQIEADYGSVNLVESFYDDFTGDGDSGFRQKYPYPAEFFKAIRYIEDFGAGQHPTFRFDSQTKQLKISAAYYLGYYLMLPKSALTDPSHELYPGDGKSAPLCDNPSAAFYKRLQDTDHDILKRNVCSRIRRAYFDLGPTQMFNQSSRARSVFGVYDGLSQWIFAIMRKERRLDGQGCFTGRDLQDVAEGSSQLHSVVLNSKVMREQAEKMGNNATDKICPWDPGLVKSGISVYRHDVETLILKGGADAVTAGGQAEYLFEKGLMPGRRALIEFPGVGHLMNFQVHSKDEDIPKAINNSMIDLIFSFLNSSTTGDFTRDDLARKAIKNLGGCLRTEPGDKCMD